MKEKLKRKYVGWFAVTLMALLTIAHSPLPVFAQGTEMTMEGRTTVTASLGASAGAEFAVQTHRVYTVELRRCSDGKWENWKPGWFARVVLRRERAEHTCWTEWSWQGSNLTTTAGLNDLLTQYLKGSSYTATWYCGLVDNASFSAYAAADTMSSHGGWLESTAYSNSNRPTITYGTASAGSIDNSASKCVFNINATATIRGSFMVTNNTKGGTTGTLFGEADYAASRSVINGDTLNVQVTNTAS